jgi:hypothetical protein
VYPTQIFDKENKKHCYMDTEEIAKAAVYTETEDCCIDITFLIGVTNRRDSHLLLARWHQPCQPICQFHQNAKCTFV